MVVAVAGAFALVTARNGSSAEPAAPHFVEETAGIDHRYAGGFEYYVGGGVATFDCDGDGRSDLYLAGGEEPAALYRNDSPAGGALALHPSGVYRHRPHARHRLLPARRRQRRARGPRRAARRRGRRAARASATVGSSGPTSCSGSTAATRGRSPSARCGRDRTPCRRWPSATTSRPTTSRVRTVGCSGPRPTTRTRHRSRSPRATARCRSCSATGSGPGVATCA